MFNFISKFIKKKNKSLDKLNPIYDYSKDEEKIIVTGGGSVAISVWDFPIPTGICSNPVSEELKEVIKKDKLGQLLNNPINQCIFCDRKTKYCFYAGDCKDKNNIPDDLLNQYKKETQANIEAKYGKRPIN